MEVPMRFIKRILLPLSFLGITLITPACGGDFENDCDDEVCEETEENSSSPHNDEDDCDDCDGDGWTIAEGDCDDGWWGTHPGHNDEWEDNEDNDCDGSVDEGCESDDDWNEFCD
jgi:hypothetical protein